MFRLCAIIGKLVTDLYGLRPIDKKTRLDLTHKHRNVLAEWRQEVTKSLGFDFPHNGPTIVQQQHIIPMLTYYHVIILLYRPFLIDIFSEVPSDRDRMKEHVQECLEASMSIVEIVGRLYEKASSFHALWVG